MEPDADFSSVEKGDLVESLERTIRTQAQEIERLRGALIGWKKWHETVAEAARSPYVERTVTLDRVKTLRARVEELEREMRRYLPVIERAEEGDLWQELTAGTGIATANGYRTALKGESNG